MLKTCVNFMLPTLGTSMGHNKYELPFLNTRPRQVERKILL